MKQQSSSYNKDYGVAADITFEGGNVTLYPRRRLVDPTKSEKVYVKDVKQFIISDVWLYNDETLGADVVVPQYTTDYWLYKAENDRVMSCGSAVPAIESVKIEGADTVSQSGSIELTAQVFPTWLPQAKKFDKDNKAQGDAFTFTYNWNPNIGNSAAPTVNASNLFGGAPAVDAETSVKCTAQLKFGGSSSAAVTSADHTVTVVADGVKVSGGSGSHGDSGHTPGVQAHSSKSEWLTGTGTETTVTLTDKATDTKVADQNTTNVSAADGVSHEDYSFDTIPDGSYTITIEKPHFAPVEKEVEISGGSIVGTVDTADLYMYGDINGDGEVKNSDKVYLARYLAGWEGYETIPTGLAVADVNGDDEVKNSDKVYLARHLAGWEGYEDLGK